MAFSYEAGAPVSSNFILLPHLTIAEDRRYWVHIFFGHMFPVFWAHDRNTPVVYPLHCLHTSVMTCRGNVFVFFLGKHHGLCSVRLPTNFFCIRLPCTDGQQAKGRSWRHRLRVRSSLLYTRMKPRTWIRRAGLDTSFGRLAYPPTASHDLDRAGLGHERSNGSSGGSLLSQLP